MQREQAPDQEEAAYLPVLLARLFDLRLDHPYLPRDHLLHVHLLDRALAQIHRVHEAAHRVVLLLALLPHDVVQRHAGLDLDLQLVRLLLLLLLLVLLLVGHYYYIYYGQGSSKGQQEGPVAGGGICLALF